MGDRDNGLRLGLDVIKRFDWKLKDSTGLRFLHDRKEVGAKVTHAMDRIVGTSGMRQISTEL